ncbi:MAG: DNA polymerase IV [Verrucomicrobiales bacterium]
MNSSAGRKIIHVDMDCFYAAIEVRDHPELRGKPVAVGGSSERRGVLTTCSYEARKFGCRSAMPTFKAMRLCPDLILMPVRFDVYRRESARIREIFHRFTSLVEPLSLDEAFLDVSHLNSSGSAIAMEIRAMIQEETQLTASAGISANKLIAKIASDWRKPNGQFEVSESAVADFMCSLPVKRLWGVGKVTEKRLQALGLETCGDIVDRPLHQLVAELGRFGAELHEMAQGIDHRKVNPSRERKSLSNERTFAENLTSATEGLLKLEPILDELEADLGHAKNRDREICKSVVKLKFADFTQTTIERAAMSIDRNLYRILLEEAWARGDGKSVRLIGAGVRFLSESGSNDDHSGHQLKLFQ